MLAIVKLRKGEASDKSRAEDDPELVALSLMKRPLGIVGAAFFVEGAGRDPLREFYRADPHLPHPGKDPFSAALAPGAVSSTQQILT